MFKDIVQPSRASPLSNCWVVCRRVRRNPLTKLEILSSLRRKVLSVFRRKRVSARRSAPWGTKMHSLDVNCRYLPMTARYLVPLVMVSSRDLHMEALFLRAVTVNA